jgi:hypothetical protein
MTIKPDYRKHTPGPWRVFNKNGVISVMSGRSPKNEVVHWAGFDSSHFPKDRLANARLIAAAPEMLEALKDIVKRNEIQHWFNLDLARAAIAKAEPPEP